eukprot:95284_1
MQKTILVFFDQDDMSTLSGLHRARQTFERSYPFESFALTSNGNPLSHDLITRNINSKIMQILNEIIDSNLALDVAFTQINVLIYYATCTINTVIPLASNDTFINYYHFLFYFMIFGCCLGTKYIPSMVVPSCRYTNNDLLRYFVDKYTNNWPKRMKYACCAPKRDSITNMMVSRMEYGITYDIALLIADFTLFEFEELFYLMTSYCFKMAKAQMGKYWDSLGFNEGSALFIMAKLLLCPSFINNDDDLTYFANQMLFKCVWWTPDTKHYKWIRNIFANHVTIQPWNDATFFIELFDDYAHKYGEDAMLHVFEQSITRRFDSNFTSFRHLCIFFDGQFCQLRDSDGDIHKDIEILFNVFVATYGTRGNIMKLLYDQILWLDHRGIKIAKGNGLLQSKVANMIHLIRSFRQQQALMDVDDVNKNESN